MRERRRRASGAPHAEHPTQAGAVVAPYRAPRWLPGGHAQTIWPYRLRRAAVALRRERVETPDGDFWEFDWIDAQAAADAPLVVLFHGLEGGSASHYARALLRAVARSLNIFRFEGCSPTNDTVIVLANGRSNVAPTEHELADALEKACFSLAQQMAGDAEGSTHTITIRVTGARTDEEAATAARKVAESQLVKCSFYGNDPYWGRVVSELGSAGVAFDPDDVTIAYGGITVCDHGVAVEHDAAAVAAHMARRDVDVLADLHLGTGNALILTNDLTHAYVDENMGTS
jgi:hypothetical protein